MKKIKVLGFLVFSCLLSQAQSTIQVFDRVLFFDGYAARVDSPAAPAGTIRQRNDLYSRRLTTNEIASIGSTLTMRVRVDAACDNYDRIGNVNMALVNKDSSTYVPSAVQRFELGRFITPFMNKNISPTSVFYEFKIDNIAQLLKDTSITNNYGIWIELEIFGVPYAANTQVAGCAGRKDVFYGSLIFINNVAAPVKNNNVLIPVSFKRNFNKYQASATDTVGKTTRRYVINIPQNLTDASIYYIISNHGANSGGEEYNRRTHYIYFNDTLRTYFVPGRTSCEPFRVYNTQSNGIYGSTPRSDQVWQSFSNWCPGDVIDIRRLKLGAVPAGQISFRINVPEAVFVNSEGNFPLSVYLHGKTSGTIDPEIVDTTMPPPTDNIRVYPNPANQNLTVEARGASAIRIIDFKGSLVYKKQSPPEKTEVFTGNLAPGAYNIQIIRGSGIETRKVIITR